MSNQEQMRNQLCKLTQHKADSDGKADKGDIEKEMNPEKIVWDAKEGEWETHRRDGTLLDEPRLIIKIVL